MSPKAHWHSVKTFCHPLLQEGEYARKFLTSFSHFRITGLHTNSESSPVPI